MKAHGGDGGNTGSDFYLVLLNNNVPVGYATYYNGWDRTNVPSSSGVCIHHPSGDIKKISTYSTGLVTDTWAYVPNTHWRVKWTTTTNGHGVTEGGSSGSPIFNSDGKIIGTLTGGSSACVSGGAGPYTGPNEPDFYGKFSYSWDKNGNNASQRLKNWLDPDNTATTILNGLFFGVKENKILESLVVYPNPTSKDLYIDFGDDNVKEINITIFNVLGKLVYLHEYFVENKLHINMSDLTSGIYFLNIQTDSGYTSRKIFVIR